MVGIAQSVIREAGTHSPREYRRRVQGLAWAYLGLFAGSIVGIILLVWRAQLFVGLAQRSNVETLTLAFFLVFFAYIMVISASGALGGLTLLRFELIRRFTHDPGAVDRHIAEVLGPPRGESPVAALNHTVERVDLPRQAFALQIQDSAGILGAVHIDGVRITHRSTIRKGSNGLLAFFVHQINEVVGDRTGADALEVVEWLTLDDEATQQYLSLVQFARNLERERHADELWPRIQLTPDHCAELERRLSAVCPALRSEGFLPDWEYAGEHKLPIIPEPLGLISLSRSEKRVDPLASMGCAALVVTGVVLLLALFIILPPWVPGT